MIFSIVSRMEVHCPVFLVYRSVCQKFVTEYSGARAFCDGRMGSATDTWRARSSSNKACIVSLRAVMGQANNWYKSSAIMWMFTVQDSVVSYPAMGQKEEKWVRLPLVGARFNWVTRAHSTASFPLRVSVLTHSQGFANFPHPLLAALGSQTLHLHFTNVHSSPNHKSPISIRNQRPPAPLSRVWFPPNRLHLFTAFGSLPAAPFGLLQRGFCFVARQPLHSTSSLPESPIIALILPCSIKTSLSSCSDMALGSF